MATVSEVKTALVSIGSLIANSTQMRAEAKSRLLAARNQLNNIPTQFSAIITQIDAYTPTGAFETLCKDEKAKLQAEFVSLRSALEAELTALGISF